MANGKERRGEGGEGRFTFQSQRDCYPKELAKEFSQKCFHSLRGAHGKCYVIFTWFEEGGGREGGGAAASSTPGSLTHWFSGSKSGRADGENENLCLLSLRKLQVELATFPHSCLPHATMSLLLSMLLLLSRCCYTHCCLHCYGYSPWQATNPPRLWCVWATIVPILAPIPFATASRVSSRQANHCSCPAIHPCRVPL